MYPQSRFSENLRKISIFVQYLVFFSFLQPIRPFICVVYSRGRLLVSRVPMREQKKNDEKGYFFRAGQCAALS